MPYLFCAVSGIYKEVPYLLFAASEVYIEVPTSFCPVSEVLYGSALYAVFKVYNRSALLICAVFIQVSRKIDHSLCKVRRTLITQLHIYITELSR